MSDGRRGGGNRDHDQSPPNAASTPTHPAPGRKRGAGFADEEASPRQSARRGGRTPADVCDASSSGPRAGVNDVTANEAATSPGASRSLLRETDPFARIESLTRELNDLKNLLPLLIASSTQPKAIAKVLARFLHKRPPTTTHSSPTGVAPSPNAVFTSTASPLVGEQHVEWDHQMPDLEATTSNPASQYTPSATPRSHPEDAMSMVSAVDQTSEEQELESRAGRRRSYIEVFGTLGRREDEYMTATADAQHVNFRVQHYLISPLWLADHEIENPEERWLNSAFHRMRDRSRSQILRGVPPEAVFGLPYPALLFSPRRGVPSMDDALTISDWVARLLQQYPRAEQDLPTRVGSWVLMTAQFQWQVNPTPETWRRIPEWFRPLPSQAFYPHLPVVDFLAWPGARERVLVSDEAWLPLISRQLTLEWPFPQSDMVTQNPSTGTQRISPEFESWCFHLPHWHLDSLGQSATPEMAEVR